MRAVVEVAPVAMGAVRTTLAAAVALVAVVAVEAVVAVQLQYKKQYNYLGSGMGGPQQARVFTVFGRCRMCTVSTPRKRMEVILGAAREQETYSFSMVLIHWAV